MKLSKYYFTVIFSIISVSGISQTSPSRIEIILPTIEQEATSIWRTINDIAFFEKQGYTINLPKDSLINTLIKKSKDGGFGNEDFSTIYTLVETKIFNPNNYERAIQKVKNQTDLINTILYKINTTKSQWDWNFKMFNNYKVVFTLYGTGGSYDPDEGTITLLTNKEGMFMNYKNPANTIIHEIAHMGMEYSIVQKYNLSHELKERVVDTFVYRMFHAELPEYRIQIMGDDKINTYLRTQDDISSLHIIVSKFMN